MQEDVLRSYDRDGFPWPTNPVADTVAPVELLWWRSNLVADQLAAIVIIEQLVATGIIDFNDIDGDTPPPLLPLDLSALDILDDFDRPGTSNVLF
jgi:hypothetical protein